MNNVNFERLRLARLWLWPLGGGLLAVLLHVIANRDASPSFVAVAYITYGLLLLAALRSCRDAGVHPMEMFPPPPRDRSMWSVVILLVPVMFTFAAMTVWATAYAASWLAPGFAQYLLEEQRDAGPFESLAGSGSALLIFFVVVVGPVIEEFVFRGLVLRRWMARSGWWRGVIGSSAIFALLHPPFWIGAMVVGVFLSMLYLATRSLYVPIAFHALYNGLVTVATMNAQDVAKSAAPTLAEFRSHWMVETALLLASGILVFAGIRQFSRSARGSSFQSPISNLPSP